MPARIPAELLEQLIPGPVTPGQLEDTFQQVKKAFIERALGAEMSNSNTPTPTFSPLRQRRTEDMRMRKFEPNTQVAPLRAVTKLGTDLPDLASTATATADDLRFEVLLRRHAQSCRTDGQDAAGQGATHLAGGAQPCAVAPPSVVARKKRSLGISQRVVPR